MNNKEAKSRIITQRDATEEPQEIFSSDGQLPVPPALNAHLSTLNSAIIYLILSLSIVLQPLIELFIKSFDFHVVLGLMFDEYRQRRPERNSENG